MSECFRWSGEQFPIEDSVAQPHCLLINQDSGSKVVKLSSLKNPGPVPLWVYLSCFAQFFLLLLQCPTLKPSCPVWHAVGFQWASLTQMYFMEVCVIARNGIR